MKFKRTQTGITLTGMIVGCIILGALALGLMKLWPVYNEKFKVDLAMDKLAASPESHRLGRTSMANLLQKQFDVNDVEPMEYHKLAKALKIGKKKGSNTKLVSLAYEIRAPLTKELDVVLNYNKTVELGSAKTD